MNIDSDRLALTQQLHVLLLDYWYDVDRNWGRTAPELFTEDGEWVAARNTFSGREGVRAFYKAREARGGRVVLHGVENFRATFDGGPDKAIATWAMVLFGGDGVAPLVTRPPVLIDYMVENWVLTSDGWKIKRRASEVLFQGGEILGDLNISAADGVHPT